MVGFVKNWPKTFEKMVTEYGNPRAEAPVGWGSGQQQEKYENVWFNQWLIKRLYNQWRYVHAIATGKQLVKNWFYFDYDMMCWEETAKRVINAEYSGNASYEWFEFRMDENGERKMYRTNWFERIESIADPRLYNPALDYLFDNPTFTIAEAFKKFKKEYHNGG